LLRRPGQKCLKRRANAGSRHFRQRFAKVAGSPRAGRDPQLSRRPAVKQVNTRLRMGAFGTILSSPLNPAAGPLRF
jgi:hypothetical protein